MDKDIDTKRKSRNLSEKKRRDQFNNLINELSNLIDPQFSLQSMGNSCSMDECDDCARSVTTPSVGGQSGCGGGGGAGASGSSKARKMDKSSVLKSAMEFLKRHETGPQQELSSGKQMGRQVANEADCASKQQQQQRRQQCLSGADTLGWKPPYISDDEFSIQMLEALDAFIVVCEVSEEPRIIYSSDTLTSLLNYKGTCNSLRESDYVSLFDLIAPSDRRQIERLFAARLGRANGQQQQSAAENKAAGCQPRAQKPCDLLARQESGARVCTAAAATATTDDGNNADECISLTVSFKLGLNLSEIKQKRSRDKTGAAIILTAQQNQHDQNKSPPPPAQLRHADELLLLMQRGDDERREVQINKSEEEAAAAAAASVGQQAPVKQVAATPPTANNKDREQLTQKQNAAKEEQQQQQQGGKEQACRGQRSIAETQQHLMSVDHKEQQEHNQEHMQQQRQQEQIRHYVEMLQVVDSGGSAASKLQQTPTITDDQQSGGGSSGDDAQQQAGSSSSAANSDENDQAASDDASDSNQSQTVGVPEHKLHHYRHHAHHHHAQHHHAHHHHAHHHHHHHHHAHHGTDSCHKHASGSQRQKLANGKQQCELVRLMATFKGFGSGSGGDDDDDDDNILQQQENHDRYKFGEPPPARDYFICIGKLDTPRFSYDLKIIAPPITGGPNLFLNNQFVSKHTLKWRFLWIDNRAPSFIGYLPFEVLGTSGYDYYHWDDLDKLVISHEGLMRDGEASSGPYRLLTKGQQWIWLKTKYTIVLKSVGAEEELQNQQRLVRNNNNKLASTPQHSFQQQQQQLQQAALTASYGCSSAQQQQLLRPTLQAADERPMAGAGYLTQMDNVDYNDFNMEHQQDYPAAIEDSRGGSSADCTHCDHETNHYQDGPIVHAGRTTDQYDGGHAENRYDDGSITYTVSFADKAELSGRKRFRASEQILSGLDPSSNNTGGEDSATGHQHDGQKQQDDSSSLTCSQLKQREIYAKSNSRLKPQSSGELASGAGVADSFIVRNLDRFKFILCTHTVIGFDESDLEVSNSKSIASIKSSSSEHHQQQQQQMHQPQQKSHTMGSKISKLTAFTASQPVEGGPKETKSHKKFD